MPDHDALVADLRVVRGKGVGNLRGAALPALAEAAGSPAPAAVEALLRAAVATLGGGRFEDAARYTFGLVPGTRMLPAADRRTKSAQALSISRERFRKGYETRILEAVAEALEHSGFDARSASCPTDHVALRTLEDAGDYNFGVLMESASGVDIIAKSPIGVLGQYSNAISQFVERGGRFRLLFYDGDPEVGRHIYASAPDGAERMRTDRLTFKARLAEIGGAAEVRTLIHLPQYSITCIHHEDPAAARMIVQFGLLYTRLERDRPIIVLDPSSPWFDVFAAEFEEAWRRGAPYAAPR